MHPATYQASMSRVRNGEDQMSLSWISNRSLKVSPKVRLVADGEAEALRRKLEELEWRPQNGFLKDQVAERSPVAAPRANRAA
jgi:hypothetical protein